jgi:hypothetical protein
VEIEEREEREVGEENRKMKRPGGERKRGRRDG